MAEGWYTAGEIAGMGLPGLPASERNMRAMADREGWDRRERSGRGGGWLYPVSALPKPAQTALARKEMQKAVAVPAQLSLDLPDAASLKTHQLTTMDARAALLAEIDRLVMTGHSITNAITAMVTDAAKGELPPELQKLVPVANARGGATGSRTLSDRSLKRWRSAVREASGNAVALAPSTPPEAPLPWWFTTFMKFYCIPTNPGMAEVLDHPKWPEDVKKPSYDQVRRVMKDISALSKNRGRVGPRAMKAMMGYKLRDTADMWPGCVFIGDGHTDKKLVQHPDSGRQFRAEITPILDVYSRRWVSFSVALAENTWAVADSLRHALTSVACCDIFYYDNGSGAKNQTWDDDCTGMTARLGITKLHSAPWSSQARGVIERFHSSVLHKMARRSVTYVGQRMDKEARQTVHKLIEADIKATGKSDVLPTWAEFIAEINAEMERYNNRPHDTLPKIVDAETGKRRHMTPHEMWTKGVAELGMTGDPISAEEARSLFRPAVRRKVARELVSWLGNEYHSAALAELHGKEVMVAYDIHDANFVEVSLLDGKWLCTAKWNGHKTGYMPVSAYQKARETRLAGQLGRNDKRRQNILDAAGPTLVIDHQPAAPMPMLTPDQTQAAEAEYARLEAKAELVPVVAEIIPSGQRPTFGDDASQVRWLLANPDRITDAECIDLRRKLQTRTFRMFLEMQGLDVSALQTLANSSGDARSASAA
jgi:putative transposase